MPRRFAQWALLGLAVGACFLAWSLSVDYFDSYDILSNARRLVGNGYGEYVRGRGLLSGPLFAGFAIVERWFPSFPFFRAAHLWSLTLTLTLVLAFLTIARRISPRHAWAGALALALNPLVVHYGVFAKEDIPATLFTVLGFAEILRRGVGSAPLWFALAGLIRANLFPAIGVTVFLFRWGQKERKGAVRLYGGWVLATLSIATIVYAWAGLGSVTTFVSDLLTQWKDNQQAYQPPSVALGLIGVALPVVVIAAGAVGALRGADAPTKLATLWAAVFIGLQTFIVSGKETRYFLPALPALYLLAVAGFERLPKVIALAWWLVLPAGLLEMARFQDPIFREPKAERVSKAAASLSRTGRVVWVGPFYPLRPAQHVLHEDDDYFSLFHLWRNGVAFHLKHEVPAIAFPQSELFNGETMPRGLGQYLETGDAILWNREPRSYATRDLPPTLAPLVIARVEIFERKDRLPSPGPYEAYSATAEGFRSLGWHNESEPPGSPWWLQLQGVSEQPLNKTEYNPYTL